MTPPPAPIPEGAPLAIIAGSGAVPVHVARAAEAAGRKVLVIGVEGEADAGIEAFNHTWMNWGQVGSIGKVVSAHGATELVLVGGIHARPDFKRLKLDLATVLVAKEILAIVSGGDNNILTGTVAFLERRGLTVIGAHEIAPDLVASPGPLGKAVPDRRAEADATLAMRAALAVGVLDAGQAAVAVDGHVVALEGAEGTDAMLARVADLRARRRVKGGERVGVLAKCAKPQQDLRVDMPTVGPKTVEGAVAAGLAGIAVETGRVMVMDREAMIRAADEAGIFVVGRSAPQ